MMDYCQCKEQETENHMDKQPLKQNGLQRIHCRKGHRCIQQPRKEC